MGTLYVVSSPIGNLSDISFRAVEILKSVDFIACEDTRVTRKLLDHYEILDKKLFCCNAINENNSSDGIIKLLNEGKTGAYLTDAGTPCVSDPGSRLVEKLRSTTDNKIVPIPGASAVLSAISIAGNIGKEWLMVGFLEKSEGKMERTLRRLLDYDLSFVLYESPFRILKLISKITELETDRQLLICRELTKIYEESFRGKATEVKSFLESKSSIKGEFVVLVYKR